MKTQTFLASKRGGFQFWQIKYWGSVFSETYVQLCDKFS